MWETNSSSIHSLQISPTLMMVSQLTISDDGYIHVPLDIYFGKDRKNYDTQLDKLKYICTWFYIYYGCVEENLSSEYGGWEWREFQEAFCNYINEFNFDNPIICKGIIVEPVLGDGAWDYLDHQSQPYGSYDDSECVVKLYDTDMCVNFIFNPYIWLHTDCD